jgi:CDP-diacylglycerol--glycerol-3-phosphate 3-phosphatidyltransferase
MALTLADKITLSRVALAPAVVAAYLLLPVDHMLCFWAAGILGGVAELTDYLDGKVARARGEVSDFGKLADPFCDVFYRIAVFLALILPAGGIGLRIDPMHLDTVARWQPVFAIPSPEGVASRDALVVGMVPVLPVALMVLRETIAGALRAMTATRGLVLAARPSGKQKAWLQGFTIITVLGLPALTGAIAPWHVAVGWWATWVCAAVSLGSISEYIWVNRQVLARLGPEPR